MTYNIGGGRRDFGSDFEKVVAVIKNEKPDLLAVQESTEYQLANQKWERLTDTLAHATAFQDNHFFGSTISMREAYHIGKTNFIQALFDDRLDLQFGNSVFSRYKFIGLGDVSISTTPANIPIFYPSRYQGNRDTEVRNVVLGRIELENLHPFFMATHLTTLVGERGGKQIPGKKEEAQNLRAEQCRNILKLVQKHILDNGEIVFLMGDFNATADEPCISEVLEKEGGFVRLIPENQHTPTHLEHEIQIDHIFAYPAERLVDYSCRIIDNETARKASDHLPVVADVTIK